MVKVVYDFGASGISKGRKTGLASSIQNQRHYQKETCQTIAIEDPAVHSAGCETNASSTGVVHETAQWGGDESLLMSQINQSQPGLIFNRPPQSQ